MISVIMRSRLSVALNPNSRDCVWFARPRLITRKFHMHYVRAMTSFKVWNGEIYRRSLSDIDPGYAGYYTRVLLPVVRYDDIIQFMHYRLDPKSIDAPPWKSARYYMSRIRWEKLKDRAKKLTTCSFLYRGQYFYCEEKQVWNN